MAPTTRASARARARARAGAPAEQEQEQAQDGAKPFADYLKQHAPPKIPTIPRVSPKPLISPKDPAPSHEASISQTSNARRGPSSTCCAKTRWMFMAVLGALIAFGLVLSARDSAPAISHSTRLDAAKENIHNATTILRHSEPIVPGGTDATTLLGDCTEQVAHAMSKVDLLFAYARSRLAKSVRPRSRAAQVQQELSLTQNYTRDVIKQLERSEQCLQRVRELLFTETWRVGAELEAAESPGISEVIFYLSRDNARAKAERFTRLESRHGALSSATASLEIGSQNINLVLERCIAFATDLGYAWGLLTTSGAVAGDVTSAGAPPAESEVTLEVVKGAVRSATSRLFVDQTGRVYGQT
ncbi:hypothetical protein MBLNU459_g0547t1 [Dothideomycetes sp. NU459]